MGLIDKYSGQNYPYHKNIKNPEEMGVSSSGSMSQITQNVGALVGYTDIMITGHSGASKAPNNGPLGNMQFISTIAKCIDINSGEQKSRSLYVNNIPTGHLNFLDVDMGNNMRGLIPGMINNITGLINPSKMFAVFTEPSFPACVEVTLPTRDKNNETNTSISGLESSGYISITDLEELQNNRMINIGTSKIDEYKTIAKKKGIPPYKTDTSNQGTKETFYVNRRLEDLSKEFNDPKKRDHDLQLFVMCVVLLYTYIYIKLINK